MSEKLKSLLLNDQIFFSLIVLFVGVVSFALGRASMYKSTDLSPDTEPSSAIISPLPEFKTSSGATDSTPVAESSSFTNSAVAEVVASKSGTKYHLSSCPGAKQIKSTNKISFSSISEAEAAGYKPAANCPGLQ